MLWFEKKGYNSGLYARNLTIRFFQAHVRCMVDFVSKLLVLNPQTFLDLEMTQFIFLNEMTQNSPFYLLNLITMQKNPDL